ncbi:winged helix DNA-binding protein [Holzapfeliella sp. He02]|uniref:HTH-type transcriptional regulator MgrA n=1 Tax=Holzapfeliella saturejae TaxID=3082953 RepID=A0ABU8SF85_9LACO
MAKVNDMLPLFSLLSRKFQNQLNQNLKPFQLNSTNYFFFLKVAKERQIKQEMLIQDTAVNASNVTRQLKHLIDLDLVYKQQDFVDRRTSIIALTEKGARIYPQVDNIITQTTRDLTRGLTPTEKRMLTQLLTKLK